ncbi:MAG TPA: hypothetical protein VFY47_09565 [Thermoleophilaceae bacterium]|nr:hypothetical protein [Thermoleophilaceae bacterium]
MKGAPWYRGGTSATWVRWVDPDAHQGRTTQNARFDGADDPLSRSSVVEAYFDGTEHDSVLGTYSITEEGETTLDAPLAAYRVEDGEVLPAR